MQRYLVLGLLACAACGSDEVAYERVESEIFATSCTFSRCHVGATPAARLALDEGGRAQLLSVSSTQSPNKLRVAPGDPANSYLMDKLLARDLATGTTLMPPTAPLAPERIDLVRRWIEAEGRENN